MNTRDVVEALRGGLTLGDLIAELQRIERNVDGVAGDVVVLFVCDYGDYHHTQQALPIREVELASDAGLSVVPSAYSQSGVCVRGGDTDSEDDEPDDDAGTDEQPEYVIVHTSRRF